jgi:hypothetical protein
LVLVLELTNVLLETGYRLIPLDEPLVSLSFELFTTSLVVINIQLKVTYLLLILVHESSHIVLVDHVISRRWW